MKKTSTILAIGSGLFLSNAQAEIESEFHVGYNSEYIFRGVDLGNDAAEFGLNFAGSTDVGLDWSAGIWSISPDGSAGNTDELDIYAAVSKDFTYGTVAVGFTAYTYDSSSTQDDADVFISFAGEPLAGYDASLTVFFGTDGALEDQILLELSAGHSFAISERVSGNFGLTYGYIADEGDGGYAQSDGSAYFSATLSLDVALSEEMTFSPYVSFIDGDDDRLVGDAKDGLILGGRVSFSF